MKAIPTEIRKRIIFLYEQGKTAQEMSELFGYCLAAIYRVRQQFRERGTVEPQTHKCGRKTLFTPERRALLTKLVEAQPDATLAQLGIRMDRPFRTSTMDLWLRELELSFKKNGLRRGTRSSGRGREKGALAGKLSGDKDGRPRVYRRKRRKHKDGAATRQGSKKQKAGL